MTSARAYIRRYRWLAAVLAVIVALALIAGPSNPATPLSPTSTAADGTKALVLLLQSLGVNVTTGAATQAGDGPALLLDDRLNDADRDSLIHWVDAGHTLVLTDPGSSLADATPVDVVGFSLRLKGGSKIPLGDCPLTSLANVGLIEPGPSQLLQSGPGRDSCFVVSGASILQARAEGQGSIVVLGGPDIWTNAYLGKADNSVLAADLLAVSGGGSVTLLGSSRVGGGQSHLLGLVSPHVWELIWQLVIAFVLLAIWRSRRLGRPVQEGVPVIIPASELVVARGNLLQEGRHRDQAAAIMRRNFERAARIRLGVPNGAPPASLAEAIAQTTGAAEKDVVSLLEGPSPASDIGLVHLAQQIDDTMREIANVE